MSDQETRFYLAREVAELLRVDTKTVYSWVKNGGVGFVRTPTGGVRIRGSEVDLMLSGRKPAGQAAFAEDET